MRIFPSIYLSTEPRSTRLEAGLFTMKNMYGGQFEYFRQRPLSLRLGQKRGSLVASYKDEVPMVAQCLGGAFKNRFDI